MDINGNKNFYKPITNINIGNRWINTDIELNYYTEYINEKLEKKVSKIKFVINKKLVLQI